MLPLLERSRFPRIYGNGKDEEGPGLKELGHSVKQALGKKQSSQNLQRGSTP